MHVRQDINFVGSKTTLSVNSGAERVAVNCGESACTGECLRAGRTKPRLICVLKAPGIGQSSPFLEDPLERSRTSAELRASASDTEPFAFQAISTFGSLPA